MTEWQLAPNTYSLLQVNLKCWENVVYTGPIKQTADGNRKANKQKKKEEITVENRKKHILMYYNITLYC